MGKPRDIDREAREFSGRLRRLMADWARDGVITENGAKFADAIEDVRGRAVFFAGLHDRLGQHLLRRQRGMLEALVARGHAPEDTADWHGFAGPVFERAWEMKYYRDDGG
jgi:hypothetical protein